MADGAEPCEAQKVGRVGAAQRRVGARVGGAAGGARERRLLGRELVVGAQDGGHVERARAAVNVAARA